LIHLTHLRLINFSGCRDRGSLNGQIGVVLPQVRVFEYLNERLRFVNFSRWDLPSLIHLRIGWVTNERDYVNALNALRRFGNGLKSLSLQNNKDGIDWGFDITSSFWNCCPKLEQLSCRFGTVVLLSGPPTGHPIGHLIIENGDSGGVERAARHLKLIGAERDPHIWPSLRRVTYSRFTWQDLFCDVPAYPVKPPEEVAQGKMRIAWKNSRAWVLLEADVPLFDSNGEMLQERYKERE
jgi:hypothetical protein